MKKHCVLWTTWADIHAAHTDPFQGGQVHGHLWRVRLGIDQDLFSRKDVRSLIEQCKEFADAIDHTNIGEISTEDIALLALQNTTADRVEVEEVGICSVLIERDEATL